MGIHGGNRQKPWNPPAPDFLQKASGAKYNGTGVYYTRPVFWWVLDDPEDPAGPFGYSFFEDTCRSSSSLTTTAATTLIMMNGRTLTLPEHSMHSVSNITLL